MLLAPEAPSTAPGALSLPSAPGSMGWLLDDLGRSTGVVPINPWAGMPEDLLP